MYSPNESVQRRVQDALKLFSDNSECWVWPKSKTKAGYGQLSTSNGSAQKVELHYAHRVSFFLKHGPFDRKMHICHHCDNPSCFNPSHLFIGTAKENCADCKRKGRNNAGKKWQLGDKHWTRAHPSKKKKVMCGENHYLAKLDEEKVKLIRSSNEKGVVLAEMFGVSASAISSVRKGKTWPLV